MSRVERNQDSYTGAARQSADGGGRRSGGSALGRVLTALGSIIMIAAIVICLGLAAPRLAKIDSYVVISGSMEPAIPVGSMVYAKACEPSELVPGDIIVFYSNNAGIAGESTGEAIPITHRVVENDTANGEIVTKGDANADVDMSPVSYYNVTGKVILRVPQLGYIASPLATTTGKIAMAMMILAGYLLTEAGARLRRRR